MEGVFRAPEGVHEWNNATEIFKLVVFNTSLSYGLAQVDP
jgi:hypothetical protein